MHHNILVCVQKLACWLPLSYCVAILYSAPCFLHTTLAAVIISLTELRLTVFSQLSLLTDVVLSLIAMPQPAHDRKRARRAVPG